MMGLSISNINRPQVIVLLLDIINPTDFILLYQSSAFSKLLWADLRGGDGGGGEGAGLK